MDAEILQKALNEIMACKTCNGSASIQENRNFHESLGTKLVLRCTSVTRKSYQINTRTWYDSIRKRGKCIPKTIYNIKSRQTCKLCNLGKKYRKVS